MRNLTATLILLFLSSPALCATLAADTSESRTVTAAGYGANEREAVEAALVSAIEEAVGALLRSEVILENHELLEENVFKKSAAFVKNYKTLAVTKEKDFYRAVIEADIELPRLRESFKKLNISTLEVANAQNAHGEVVTKAQSVEGVRKHIKTELFNGFLKGEMFSVNISSLEYAEGQLENGVLPFAITFTLSINSAYYDGKLKILTDELVKYGIAEEKHPLGRLGATPKSFYLDRYKINLNYPAGLLPSLGDLKCAEACAMLFAVEKYGQSYQNVKYTISNNYKTALEEVFSSLFRESARKVKLTVALGDLFEDSFPLASSGKLSACFEGVCFPLNGADISVSSLLFYSGQKSAYYLLSPHIFLTLDNYPTPIPSLSLRYQGKIKADDIRRIKSVTVKAE